MVQQSFRKKIFLLVLILFFFFFLLDMIELKSAFSKAMSMIRYPEERAILQGTFSGVFVIKSFLSLLGIVFTVMYVKWIVTPYHKLAMKVLRKTGNNPRKNEGYGSALRKAHEILDKQDKLL